MDSPARHTCTLAPTLAPALALALAAALAARVAGATENTPRSMSDVVGTVSIGLRAAGRAGPYLGGGPGGQLRLRPHELLSIELFWDNLLSENSGSGQSLLRHDHEVGFTLQLNVVHQRRFVVFPSLGMCAALAMVNTPNAPNGALMDIQFGLRAGLGVEGRVSDHFGLEAHAEALAYAGHAMQVYSFSAEVRPELQFWGAGQLTLGVNYYF